MVLKNKKVAEDSSDWRSVVNDIVRAKSLIDAISGMPSQVGNMPSSLRNAKVSLDALMREAKQWEKGGF